MTESRLPAPPDPSNPSTPPLEPDAVAFVERVQRPGAPGRMARGGVVVGAAVLFVVGAVAVMAASPSPAVDPGSGAGSSSSPSTAPSTVPDATKDGHGPAAFPRFGGFGGFGGPGFGFGGDRGGFGFGFGGVTITAISGSNLSLKTEDGWTRTIAVTSDTKIDRAGKAIAVGDLKVGDQISFRQERATDGTYTISAVEVVLPSIAGQVTAVDGSTITVKRFDGTTAKINVDSDTTYAIAGKTDASLSDVTVDTLIVATGTQRADGSLDAEAIRGGLLREFGGGDHPGHGPDASPGTSATPG